MSESVDVTIAIKPQQLDYLKRMAQEHDLPDEGKAIRCLVNYAIETADKEGEIFDEIRCRGC